MLACTRQADGTLALDYQQSLRCDEDWWTTWSKIGILCLCVYGVGIPLLYAFIFFHLRPPVRTYAPSFLPRALRSIGERAWCLCPRACNRREWKARVLKDKRARVYTGAAVALESYVKLQMWNKTFKTLVQPFRVSRYFWSCCVILRSFMISLCAAFLLNAPIYQCAMVLVVLGIALLLQLSYRPYKFHIKYNLNALETTSLVSQLLILICGMIFRIASVRHQSSLDLALMTGSTTSSMADYRYPLFRSFLEAVITVCTIIVAVMAAYIFVAQIRFRLRYDYGWRHSHTRQKLNEWEEKVQQFVAVKVLRRQSSAAVEESTSPVPNASGRGKDLMLESSDQASAPLVSRDETSPAGEVDPTKSINDTDTVITTTAPTSHRRHKSLVTNRHSIYESGVVSTLDDVDLENELEAAALTDVSHYKVHSQASISATPWNAFSSLKRAGRPGELAPLTGARFGSTTVIDPPITTEERQSTFGNSNKPPTAAIKSLPIDGTPSPMAESSPETKPSNEIDCKTSMPVEIHLDDGPNHSHHDESVARGVNSSPTHGHHSMTPTHASEDVDGQHQTRTTPTSNMRGASPSNKPGHSRLKSSIWQPPRMSTSNPLRALDAKSMFTHARYVSLNDLSLRQILEINESAAILEAHQDTIDEELGQHHLQRHHPPPLAHIQSSTPPPAHVRVHVRESDLSDMRIESINSSHRLTPSLLAPSVADGFGVNPSAQIRALHPKSIPGVDIGKPTYGRWFKPPPPAGLFMRRVAMAATHLAQLRKMFSNDESDDDVDFDEPEKFAAYHARVKKNRHMRNITFLVGKLRLRDFVYRLIARRAHAKRLGLKPSELDPVTGVAKYGIDISKRLMPPPPQHPHLISKPTLPLFINGSSFLGEKSGGNGAKTGKTVPSYILRNREAIDEHIRRHSPVQREDTLRTRRSNDGDTRRSSDGDTRRSSESDTSRSVTSTNSAFTPIVRRSSIVVKTMSRSPRVPSPTVSPTITTITNIDTLIGTDTSRSATTQRQGRQRAGTVTSTMATTGTSDSSRTMTDRLNASPYNSKPSVVTAKRRLSSVVPRPRSLVRRSSSNSPRHVDSVSVSPPNSSRSNFRASQPLHPSTSVTLTIPKGRMRQTRTVRSNPVSKANSPVGSRPTSPSPTPTLTNSPSTSPRPLAFTKLNS